MILVECNKNVIQLYKNVLPRRHSRDKNVLPRLQECNHVKMILLREATNM